MLGVSVTSVHLMTFTRGQVPGVCECVCDTFAVCTRVRCEFKSVRGLWCVCVCVCVCVWGCISSAKRGMALSAGALIISHSLSPSPSLSLPLSLSLSVPPFNSLSLSLPHALSSEDVRHRFLTCVYVCVCV